MFKLIHIRNILFNNQVLMVAGFYFFQICAVASINIFNQPLVAFFHAFLHLGAIGSLIAGLVAIFMAHSPTQANLTSLHSWYGIAAACLYMTNVFLGLIKVCIRKETEAHNRFISLHRFVGFTAIIATSVAISTGIVNYIGPELCRYNVDEYQWNPAAGYDDLPEVCKLVNGLGILIITGALLSAYLLFVSIEYDAEQKASGNIARTGGFQNTSNLNTQSLQPNAPLYNSYPLNGENKAYELPKSWAN